MRRRQLLTLGGVGIIGSVGGCADVVTENTESSSGTPTQTDPRSETVTPSTPDRSASSDDSATDPVSPSGTSNDATLTKPANWPPEVYADYETAWVQAETAGGETLDSVYTAVADTGGTRYTGLSDAETMPGDAGMLFVFDSVFSGSFVMRRMDFGIDIVYADSTGAITEIHHAPAPGPDEDGNSQGYPGTGKYVLEVNYDWTQRAGVSVGDVLNFDL